MKKLMVLLPILAGCGSDRDLMPLKVGNRWSYQADSMFVDSTTELRVVRETGVAETTGYVLSGPTGEIRMAWKDDVLLLERTSNMMFNPPLPILVANSNSRVERRTNVKCQGFWGTLDGKAELDQIPWKETIGGQKIAVVKSEVVFLGGGHRLRLVTTFQPGAGILTQRQWVDGKQVLSLERIGGS